MARTSLTPGKLYARLSTEFRRLRPRTCGNCRMPMVALTHRAAPDDCNWAVEESAPLCEECKALVSSLVKEAGTRYDLRDPISIPYFPHKAALRARPGLGRV